MAAQRKQAARQGRSCIWQGGRPLCIGGEGWLMVPEGGQDRAAGKQF